MRIKRCLELLAFSVSFATLAHAQSEQNQLLKSDICAIQRAVIHQTVVNEQAESFIPIRISLSNMNLVKNCNLRSPRDLALEVTILDSSSIQDVKGWVYEFSKPSLRANHARITLSRTRYYAMDQITAGTSYDCRKYRDGWRCSLSELLFRTT